MPTRQTVGLAGAIATVTHVRAARTETAARTCLAGGAMDGRLSRGFDCHSPLGDMGSSATEHGTHSRHTHCSPDEDNHQFLAPNMSPVLKDWCPSSVFCPQSARSVLRSHCKHAHPVVDTFWCSLSHALPSRWIGPAEHAIEPKPNAFLSDFGIKIQLQPPSSLASRDTTCY